MACTLVAYGLFATGYIASATSSSPTCAAPRDLPVGRHRLLVPIWTLFGRRRVRLGAHPRPAKRRVGNGGHAQPPHNRDRGAAGMAHAGRRLPFRPSFRRLFSRRRGVVRTPRVPTACRNGRDWRPDRFVRNRPVHRPGAEQGVGRWTERPQGRSLAFGRDLRRRRRRCSVSARAGGAVVRWNAPQSYASLRSKAFATSGFSAMSRNVALNSAISGSPKKPANRRRASVQ